MDYKYFFTFHALTNCRFTQIINKTGAINEKNQNPNVI